MGAWFRDFWNDKAAFAALFGRGANWLRGAMMTIALGVASGVYPFTVITEELGKLGYVGAGILIILTVMVRAGDKTPPALRNLTPAQLDRLVALAMQQSDKPPAI